MMKSYCCHQRHQEQLRRHCRRHTAHNTATNMQSLITKYKLLLFLLLLMLALTFSGHELPLPALVMAQPYRADFYNGKCTDAQTGRQLYVGEAFTRPGVCVRVQCLGTLQLWEDNCRLPELKNNCTSVPTTRPFDEHPHCCPMYECRTYAMDATGKTEETRTYDHHGILRKTVIEQVFVMDGIDGVVRGNGNHVCHAYKGIIPPNEEHPGKCLYRDEVLQLGVNYSNAPCQKLICLEDGSIEVEGCGKVRIENCNRGERMNLNKSFPECCWFKYKCKNPDGSSYYIDRNMAENAA